MICAAQQDTVPGKNRRNSSRRKWKLGKGKDGAGRRQEKRRKRLWSPEAAVSTRQAWLWISAQRRNPRRRKRLRGCSSMLGNTDLSCVILRERKKLQGFRFLRFITGMWGRNWRNFCFRKRFVWKSMFGKRKKRKNRGKVKETVEFTALFSYNERIILN